MAAAWSKLKARVVLFFLFVSQLVRRLALRKQRHGLERFLTQYASDGVIAVSEAERARFPAYQRCQACSQCTFSCIAIREGKAPAAFEPKYIMLVQGRSAHESEYFMSEWIPCLQCADCTVHCPNGVPVHEMAERIRERRSRIGATPGA